MAVIKQRVLTEYEADASGQIKELEKLSRSEEKRASALEKHAAQEEASTGFSIENLAKVAAGVAAVTGAYAALSTGIEAYAEESRLRAATVGLDLAGLQDATLGLADGTRLLDFASKAMNGTFKLSQAEMEQALQGAVALRKTLGIDLTTALDATQKAITEGTVEPLKSLGIVIKDVANDTEEGLTAALKALAIQAKEAGPDLRIPGDEMAKASVNMSNAVSDLNIAIGELAQSLSPVISEFARLISFAVRLSDVIAGIDAADKATTTLKSAEISVASQEQRIRDIILSQEAQVTDPGSTFDRLLFGGGRKVSSPELTDALFEAEKELILREKRLGRIRAEAAIKSFPDASSELLEIFTGAAGSLTGVFGGATIPSSKGRDTRAGVADISTISNEEIIALGESIIAAQNEETRARLAAKGTMGLGDISGAGADIGVSLTGATESLNTLLQEFAMAQAMTDQSNLIAGIFGTPAEIDSTAAALGALTTGFDGLANAFGSGVDALITGSGSFAAAFKDAIGETLRAMAVDMSIRAFREAAFGIAELAVGNLPAAALHGKAAAAYGVGALAAGIAAKGLGAGGQATSTPTTQTGAGSTAGTSGVGAAIPQKEGSGTTQVFILGDDFGSLSSRERESRFREISRAAGVKIDGDVVIDG